MGLNKIPVLYFLFQNIFLFGSTRGRTRSFHDRHLRENKCEVKSSIVTQEGPWQLHSNLKKKSSMLCQWNQQLNIKDNLTDFC